MLPSNPNNGETRPVESNVPRLPSSGDNVDEHESHRLSLEVDSTCSTPYVSAPSSPSRVHAGYFFSAPASPMHFVLSTAPASSYETRAFSAAESSVANGSSEFEFSSRVSYNGSGGNGSMSSADELFLNGQIRPITLSSHLQRPQVLAPLLDLEVEAEGEDENRDDRKYMAHEKREGSFTRGRDLRSRNGSAHRKARSMSPLRTVQLEWQEDTVIGEEESNGILELEVSENKQTRDLSTETTPSGSASSSRSSSSGRNSKKWIFLKDLLHRSKSEGRGNSRQKLWSSMTSSGREKKVASPFLTPSSSRDEKQRTPTEKLKEQKIKQVPARKHVAGKPAKGVAKRQVPPSAHELHYTANRAQAEEMKKKTYLPYRRGLLGCLGFSSTGYGAVSGFARTLNPVSST
ncbi:hypothetical protein NMG60_11035084 [Bertholletia excelsa]